MGGRQSGIFLQEVTEGTKGEVDLQEDAEEDREGSGDRRRMPVSSLFPPLPPVKKISGSLGLGVWLIRRRSPAATCGRVLFLQEVTEGTEGEVGLQEDAEGGRDGSGDWSHMPVSSRCPRFSSCKTLPGSGIGLG
jgi:hypothetical protein